MRLNGFMGLIAVVCVAGVMSDEILGPMAKLRFSRVEEAGGNEGGRAVREGLAGALFSDESLPPSAEPLALGPPPRGLPPAPDLVTSPLVPFEQVSDQDGYAGATVYPVSALGDLPGSAALSQADLAPSTQTTPFSLLSSSRFSSQPASDFIESGANFAAAPPPAPSAAPEPPNWLILILGLGGVGFSLRHRRARPRRLAVARLPN